MDTNCTILQDKKLHRTMSLDLDVKKTSQNTKSEGTEKGRLYTHACKISLYGVSIKCINELDSLFTQLRRSAIFCHA
jgi:hypothetical protein